MKSCIVTISREFGSGGRYLGEKLAAELGIPFYDKEIIAQVVEKTGLAKDAVENQGEYASRRSLFSYGLSARTRSGLSVEDYLYSVQRMVILEAAQKGSCVIVGRNADFILRERTDCMHVFISGNSKEKLERICRLYQKTEAEARKLLHDVDKKRAVNYQFYTEREWGQAANYTVCLNSSELGYDSCLRILTQLYREKTL